MHYQIIYMTQRIYKKAAFATNLHRTSLEGINIDILFIKKISIQLTER